MYTVQLFQLSERVHLLSPYYHHQLQTFKVAVQPTLGQHSKTLFGKISITACVVFHVLEEKDSNEGADLFPFFETWLDDLKSFFQLIEALLAVS